MSRKIKPVMNENSTVKNRKLKRFATAANVEQYAEENDILLVIFENKVYNIQKFQYEHPGGADILEDFQGQDVTNIFYNGTRHRHSQNALNLLQKYLFGEIGEGADDEKENLKNQADQEYPLLTHENKLKYSKVTLDLSQGLVSQIKDIKDKSVYKDMITHPCRRVVGTRLFSNDLVDSLFNNNIGIVITIYTVMFLYLLYQALDLSNNYHPGLFDKHIKKGNRPLSYISLLFSGGLFIFWIMEYFYLRLIIQPFLLGKTLHFLFLGIHYVFPLDDARTTIQPIFTLTVSVCLRYILGFFIYGNTLYLLLSGMCLGYIIYELIHYAVHNKKTFTFGYFRNLRAKHAKHHFKDREYGYQVTNHFWDKFFELTNLDEEDKQKEILELRRKQKEERRKPPTPPDSSDSD